MQLHQGILKRIEDKIKEDERQEIERQRVEQNKLRWARIGALGLIQSQYKLIN